MDHILRLYYFTSVLLYSSAIRSMICCGLSVSTMFRRMCDKITGQQHHQHHHHHHHHHHHQLCLLSGCEEKEGTGTDAVSSHGGCPIKGVGTWRLRSSEIFH